MTSDLVEFLADRDLLSGLARAELEQLARAMERVSIPAGAALWQQGEPATGLHIVEAGAVTVTLLLPGERETELTRVGVGEVLGEIPLIAGGTRTATVRAVEPTSVLVLAQDAFRGLVAQLSPAALALERRITVLACARLRRVHKTLAEQLCGAAPDRDETDPGEPGSAPPLSFVRRLPLFRELDGEHTALLIERGGVLHIPARRIVLAEGETPQQVYVILNGAVEERIDRGRSRIRVRLAGPGRALGYTSLLDGQPTSVTAATRERTLLLAVPADDFQELIRGDDRRSHALLAALQRDLVSTLRMGDRPQAQLAAQR